KMLRFPRYFAQECSVHDCSFYPRSVRAGCNEVLREHELDARCLEARDHLAYGGEGARARMADCDRASLALGDLGRLEQLRLGGANVGTGSAKDVPSACGAPPRL